MSPSQIDAAVLASALARVVELEIRSEERRAEVVALQLFVEGYEQRITRLESVVSRLRDELESPPDAMPPPDEDLPPHY